MRALAAWAGFAACVLSPVPVFAVVLSAGPDPSNAAALAATVAGLACYFAGVAGLWWGARRARPG